MDEEGGGLTAAPFAREARLMPGLSWVDLVRRGLSGRARLT